MNKNYSAFLTKFFTFLISLLVLIPIASQENFYLFLLIFTLFIFSPVKKNIEYSKVSLFIFLLVILSFFSNNYKLKIGKGLVIINENSKNFYDDNLPHEVFNFFLDKFEFYKKNSKCEINDNKCWKSFDPNVQSDKFEKHNIIF